MSDVLGPILDWLANHSPAWRPPPVPARKHLAHLPEPLMVLYESGGHAPGAFPRACARERWLRAPAQVSPTPEGWTLTEIGPQGGWFVRDDGTLRRQQADYAHSGLVDAGTIDQVLTAHLAALAAGELVFNPLARAFLYPDERPDLRWAPTEIARGAPYVVERVTRELRAGREVPLGGLGSFRVVRPRVVEAFGARHRPHPIPSFRCSLPLTAWLAGDPIDERDPLLEALVHGLIETGACGWPGLGLFRVRPIRTGSKGVIFWPWERLLQALDADGG